MWSGSISIRFCRLFPHFLEVIQTELFSLKPSQVYFCRRDEFLQKFQVPYSKDLNTSWHLNSKIFFETFLGLHFAGVTKILRRVCRQVFDLSSLQTTGMALERNISGSFPIPFRKRNSNTGQTYVQLKILTSNFRYLCFRDTCSKCLANI